MKKNIFIIFFIVIILFYGCKSKINDEEINNIFRFTGTWRIDSVEKLVEKEENEENYSNLIGKEIKLSNNKINVAGSYKENIHYKLKVVEGDYIISYENNLTMNDFMNGRETVDLISIIDENQIIFELFLNSDTEMIFL